MTQAQAHFHAALTARMQSARGPAPRRNPTAGVASTRAAGAPDPDEMLTFDHVAHLFHVSVRTVQEWEGQGLPVFRCGRVVRVRRRDLDAIAAVDIVRRLLPAGVRPLLKIVNRPESVRTWAEANITRGTP